MSIPEQFSVSGVDVQNHPVVGPAASGGGGMQCESIHVCIDSNGVLYVIDMG